MQAKAWQQAEGSWGSEDGRIWFSFLGKGEVAFEVYAADIGGLLIVGEGRESNLHIVGEFTHGQRLRKKYVKVLVPKINAFMHFRVQWLEKHLSDE